VTSKPEPPTAPAARGSASQPSLAAAVNRISPVRFIVGFGIGTISLTVFPAVYQ